MEFTPSGKKGNGEMALAAFLTAKSTATEYMFTTTAFYLKNVLDVLSSTPARIFLRTPGIHKHLLSRSVGITIYGVKSGLGLDAP